MVEYKCIRCGFKNANLGLFKKHLNRVTLCDPKVADVSLDEEREKWINIRKDLPFKCPCGKNFKCRQGIYLHKKICNISDEISIKFLEKELMEFKNNPKKQSNDDTNRKESFYQKYLEKQFGGTHKKLKRGITDITTENKHIEIKNWISWKDALYQLLLYNIDDRKDYLEVYLFGSTPPPDKKQMIFESFQYYNIIPYEIIDNEDGSLTFNQAEEIKVDFNIRAMHNIIFNGDKTHSFISNIAKAPSQQFIIIDENLQY